MPSTIKRITSSPLFFALACLVLVMLLNVFITGNIFKVEMVNGTLNGPLITILNRSSELVILALGMTVVVSASSGVDISVGSVMALSSAVGVFFLAPDPSFWGANRYVIEHYSLLRYLLCLVVAVIVGALCGTWNGFLVARLKVQPMVATLILYIGARGAAKAVSNGQYLTVNNPDFKIAGGVIADSAGSALFPLPTPILIAIGMVIITALVLRFTASGMNIQSVGVNNKASRIMGLNPTRIILVAFIFCGVCAAVAGIIASSRLGRVDFQNEGKMLELDGILAVALGGNSLAGGKFSLPGSIIGAVTIQTLTTVLYSINVSANQLALYKAIVVVLIVVLQSPELRPMLGRLFGALRRRPAQASTHELTVSEVVGDHE